MSRTLVIILSIIIGGFITLVAISKSQKQPEEAVIGQAHESQGRKHIQSGAEHEPYNSDLPSSGPHYPSPAPWGISEQEVPDETFIHNLEHGGIVIAYQSDLPQEKIDQLKKVAQNLAVNDSPNAKKGFKVLLTPRSKNTKPVQLAGWTYTLNLDSVDEDKITKFYRQHLNKAPEPSAM